MEPGSSQWCTVGEWEITGTIRNKRVSDQAYEQLLQRAVKQWSSLPREAVQSTLLEVFKTLLDKALSNLVWLPSHPSSPKSKCTDLRKLYLYLLYKTQTVQGISKKKKMGFFFNPRPSEAAYSSLGKIHYILLGINISHWCIKWNLDFLLHSKFLIAIKKQSCHLVRLCRPMSCNKVFSDCQNHVIEDRPRP